MLLVAPTGAGKTLAGFLPSLVELAERALRRAGGGGAPHPLRLAPQGARRRHRPQPRDARPRDGAAGPRRDPHRRHRLPQARPADRAAAGHPAHHARSSSPCSSPTGRRARSSRGLRRVVLDELHALVTSKRGDLLSLGLARLFRLAPGLTTIGLSATVREPDELRRYLVAQAPPLPAAGEGWGGRERARGGEGSAPRLTSLPSAQRLSSPQRETSLADLVVVEGGAQARHPHAGARPAAAHGRAYGRALHAGDLRPHPRPQDHARLRQHPHAGRVRLPGALEPERGHPRHRPPSRLPRRRPAPPGRGGDGRGQAQGGGLHRDPRSRHRLGRRRPRRQRRRAEGREPDHAAHRPLQPPHGRALEGLSRPGEPLRDPRMLAPPSTRCTRRPRTRRTPASAPSTCSASTCSAWPAPSPSRSTTLYEEVRSAAPYSGLPYEEFEPVVDFVATGGYALRAYERFAKIVKGADGLWRVRDGRVAQQYRMNVGTIIEATMPQGAPRPRVARQARHGAAAGRAGARRGRGDVSRDALARRHLHLRRRGPALRGHPRGRGPRHPRRGRHRPEDPVLRRRQVPALDLPRRARARLSSPTRSSGTVCRRRSVGMAPAAAPPLRAAGPARPPGRDLPAPGRFYLVAYPFEGRLAHQTLGMLLTRRLERARPEAARLRRQRLRPRGLRPAATSARGTGASPASSTRSSPRTCSATTWRTGSTNPR